MSLFDGYGAIRRSLDYGDVGGGLLSLVQLLGCHILSYWLTQGRACGYLIVVNDSGIPGAAETVLELLHLIESNHSLEGYDQSGGFSCDKHLSRLGFFMENYALVVDQIIFAVIS